MIKNPDTMGGETKKKDEAKITISRAHKVRVSWENYVQPTPRGPCPSRARGPWK